MSALESEDQDASRVFGGHGDSHSADATHGDATGISSSSLNRGKPTMMDEAVFREKLKNMGMMSSILPESVVKLAFNVLLAKSISRGPEITV